MIVIGLSVILIKAAVFRKKTVEFDKWVLRIYLGIAITWTFVVFILTFTDYCLSVSTMKNKEAMIVEGLVESFNPRIKAESFIVDGVKFEYSDCNVTAGFNHMASQGGPIKKGLSVKIWYIGNEIIRLDIKKPNKSVHANHPQRGSFGVDKL